MSLLSTAWWAAGASVLLELGIDWDRIEAWKDSGSIAWNAIRT